MQFSKLAFYSITTTFLLVINVSPKADTEFAYDTLDISALQNEYQKQLKKPKAVTKKRRAKKSTTRPTSKPSNLTFEQQARLLNSQQQSQKQRQLQVRNRQLTLAKQKQLRQQQRRAQQQNTPTQIAKPRVAPRAPAPTINELFEAANRGDVRKIGQLISSGVNVNSGNAERETALHMAAAKGHYSAVIYLINHGANINSRTVNNWLPIHHATRFRHAQIANYLKQRGSSPHARTADGLSAIDMAKANNDRRILGAFGVR